jgi:putative serine protease PepD
MSLWNDDRTYETPPRHEGSDPVATPPAAAGSDPKPPGGGDDSLPPAARDRGRLMAAIGGGTVSAVVVSAVLLGTGLAGGDDSSPTATAPTPAPVVSNVNDNKGDLVRSVYAAASPSVVSVRTGTGSGTGFLVDGDGTIVTNAHVVGDNQQVQVRFNDKSDFVDAQVLSVDASTDLAALKVDESAAQGVRPLKLADSDNVQVGDTAIAIGYPLGLDRTATAGIISGLERQIQSPNGFSIDKVIQTDAPINPGNSGGPLLNANGEVIGVNSQIATAGGGEGSVGIGFAIPANTVKQVLPALESGSAPEHAYLGLQTTTPQNGDDGAQIAQATPGGPSASAGLQAGDVVTKVDGQDVHTPDDVAAAIQDNKPGDKVEVTVRRGGSERTIDVTLGQRPEQVQSQQQDQLP